MRTDCHSSHPGTLLIHHVVIACDGLHHRSAASYTISNALGWPARLTCIHTIASRNSTMAISRSILTELETVERKSQIGALVLPEQRDGKTPRYPVCSDFSSCWLFLCPQSAVHSPQSTSSLANLTTRQMAVTFKAPYGPMRLLSYRYGTFVIMAA